MITIVILILSLLFILLPMINLLFRDYGSLNDKTDEAINEKIDNDFAIDEEEKLIEENEQKQKKERKELLDDLEKLSRKFDKDNEDCKMKF